MDSAIKTKIKCEDSTIVISDEDETSKPNKDKLKMNKSKQKRKVSVNTKDDNVETLTITQNVKVKKQNIECVINLSTNVYDNSDGKSIDKKQKQDLKMFESISTNLNYSRKTPTCCRKKCETKNIEKPRLIKHESKSHHCKCKNKKPKVNYKDNKYSTKQKTSSKIKIDSQLSLKCDAQRILSLSPISLSPIFSDISYEDISLDSFTTCSESELDSLIKRTKERDRRTPLIDFGIQKLCRGNYKNVIEISSDEELIDDKNFKRQPL